MNKAEVAKLLVMVSSLDRQPTDEGMVEMWHRILGGYEFSECEEALVSAYREAKGYMSARGVEVAVKKLRNDRAEKLESETRLQLEAEVRKTPPPSCVEHGSGIASCVPCGVKIYEMSLRLGSGPALHSWATENIFQGMSA
jgi:hypothetical protein